MGNSEFKSLMKYNTCLSCDSTHQEALSLCIRKDLGLFGVYVVPSLSAASLEWTLDEQLLCTLLRRLHFSTLDVGTLNAHIPQENVSN